MNNYGQYTEEVMEIVNFIRSGGILKTKFQNKQFDGFEVEVIDSLSLDELKYYCDPESVYAEIEGAYWEDIIEENSHTLFHIPDHEFSDTVLPLIEELTSHLYEEITEQVENLEDERYVSMDRKFIRFFYVFFYNFILHRAQAGIVPETMYEKLFKVFQASGCPVGWSGKFPDGKLVVYSK